MVKAVFLASLLAAATVAAVPLPAAAAALSLEDATATLTPNAYVWQDDGRGGPVNIVVSLPDQMAYVYRGTTLIAVSTVSSGKDGKETPIGRFPILQKETEHQSNLYNAAPMPFMQRLTWDGVALHAGNNPGFPASHGCIRLPAAFARKLFAITRVGTSVSVTDRSINGVGPAAAYSTDPETEATAAANAMQMPVSYRP